MPCGIDVLSLTRPPHNSLTEITGQSIVTFLRQKHGWIILLLGLLSVITPFAIDMYLPAFSRMAGDLKTTTTVISLSLSSYFIGFALGQILYGPLLDRFGRKRPLYFGLILYILASVGCAQAHSIHALIVIRFIQALGGCAAQVAAIAMVRDFFPVNENAKVLSLLFLIIGVSPLLAPTIGSALVSALGWRWIFILLAANAFMILTLTFTLLPEGHTPDASISLKPKPIIQSYWTIFRQPQFITYALSGAFSFAGLFAFVAGSPIIFMGGFQVFTGLVFLAGTRIHVIGLPAMLALFFFFLLSIGLTTPNAAALGLAPFSRDAGSASALLGSLQAGTGSLISTGIGVLGASAIVKLMVGTAFAALIILIAGRTRIVELTETSESEAVSVLH